jgi:hypothetical protein
MAKKHGGRHGSVGTDWFVKRAVKDIKARYPGSRIVFGYVKPHTKGAIPGRWKLRTARASVNGGIPVTVYSDSFTLEARLYLRATRPPIS